LHREAGALRSVVWRYIVGSIGAFVGKLLAGGDDLRAPIEAARRQVDISYALQGRRRTINASQEQLR